MTNAKVSIKISFPAILATAFLLVFFYAKLVVSSTMIANGLIAATGILCFIYSLSKRKIGNNGIMVGLLLSLLMFMSILYNGNSSYFEIAWIWCYMGVAYLLANFKISSNTITMVFLVVCLTFASLIISGTDPQKALTSVSGNNISVIVLFYVMLIYIKRHEENKPIIYWPIIFAILFSVWGNGRSGLITCALLLVCIFIYGYFYVGKKKLSTLLKIAILVAVGLFFLDKYFGTYIETFLFKIDKYGLTSARTDIWKEYISLSFDSLLSFLLGAPTISDKAPTLAWVNGNPHNAFLVLHSKFGILGFLIGIAAVIKSFFRFARRKEYLYLIIIIIWFIRSMFDWIGFPGVFDVIFFYFILKSGSKDEIHKQVK